MTPTTINKTSIQVTGSSDSFNITWQPVENVNYGTVFYEVQIGSFSRNESIVIQMILLIFDEIYYCTCFCSALQLFLQLNIGKK